MDEQTLMVTASNFYSCKNPSRFTTLFEARNHVDLRNTQNILILPSSTSNIDINTDVADLSEQLNIQDALFEPGGELQVEHEYSGGEEYNEKNKRW